MATVNLVDLTRRPVSIAADAHVVVAVVRNEILRLPFFISYYRDKGFDTFVFIDNESTDGTRDFLVAQPDAVVLGVSQDYAASRHGLTWTNAVLNQLCVGRWVLVVDADEQLVWP